MSKKSTRERELSKKVLCSLLAAGVMSVCISGRDAWAQSVDYGAISQAGGRRVIYTTLPDDVTVNNDNATAMTTVTGESLTIDYAEPVGNATVAVQARAEHAMDVYPELSITMQDSLIVKSIYTAVTGQDGKVNLTSNNGDVILSTSFTSGEALPADKTVAQHLSDKGPATIYARNLFATDTVAGEVNVSGKNVQVLTAEKTMTGTGMENVKYGTAISGNGNGAINIHATDTVVIKGAIESLNDYMQKNGTTGIKVNINQGTADTAKVDMAGLFINAADKSEVNIKGAAGSSIKTDLIASATTATAGSGGKINIDFADGGSIEGAVTAQNGGHITMTGADISGMVKVTGTDSGLTVNSGTVEFDASSVDYAGGSEYRHAALFVSDGAKAEYGTKTVIDKMVFNSANALQIVHQIRPVLLTMPQLLQVVALWTSMPKNFM